MSSEHTLLTVYICWYMWKSCVAILEPCESSTGVSRSSLTPFPRRQYRSRSSHLSAPEPNQPTISCRTVCCRGLLWEPERVLQIQPRFKDEGCKGGVKINSYSRALVPSIRQPRLKIADSPPPFALTNLCHGAQLLRA